MSIKQTLAEAVERAAQRKVQPKENKPIVEETREWNRTTCHFINCPPISVQDYSFKYLGKDPIDRVEASCGCTAVLQEDNDIKGYWYISEDGALGKGQTKEISRELTVFFHGGKQETLTLKATVNKALW